MREVFVQPKFSNAQLEILKLFKEDIPTAQLEQLRRILFNFLLDNVLKEAETTAKERRYDDEMLQKIVRG